MTDMIEAQIVKNEQVPIAIFGKEIRQVTRNIAIHLSIKICFILVSYGFSIK